MTEGIWLSLDDLIAQREARRAQDRAEAAVAAQRKAAEAARYAEAFHAYRLTPDDHATIMRRIVGAFERGEQELELFTFPSELCPDGGRRINNQLEGWEETLPGAARRVYELWREHLAPRGYSFSARIVSYPDGMPGDVGIVIGWKRKEA